jgi:hypothetical protein
MFNNFFKKNYVMTGLIISALPFCGGVSAAEFKPVPDQVVQGQAQKGYSGIPNAAVGVFSVSAAGEPKDRSMPNSAQVTTATTEDTRLNPTGIFVQGQN